MKRLSTLLLLPVLLLAAYGQREELTQPKEVTEIIEPSHVTETVQPKQVAEVILPKPLTETIHVTGFTLSSR